MSRHNHEDVKEPVLGLLQCSCPALEMAELTNSSEQPPAAQLNYLNWAAFT